MKLSPPDSIKFRSRPADYRCRVWPVSASEPAAALVVALTDEAVHALGGMRQLSLTRFPVTFGREQRIAEPARRRGDERRRHGATRPVNDVYLRERPEAGSFHISGAHFAIEWIDGRFFLVDRESACGTIVAGRRIGGHRAGGRTDLRDGDQIVVGTHRSRFIFQFSIVGDAGGLA